MIGSEAQPFSKTGGLADVTGALPAALGRLGHKTTLVVPRYRSGNSVEQYGMSVGHLTLDFPVRRVSVEVLERPLATGADVWLLDCPDLYGREHVYGVGSHDYEDSPLRFASLCRAAIQMAIARGARVDVVHAHDWQGGLGPVYLRTRYSSDYGVGGTASVFTIHNIAYQGLFPREWIPALGLDWSLFHAEGIEYWGRISLLKAGINFSDVITTVSRKYAQEIQTPEYGYGFEGIVARRRADLQGITNGIDTSVWDPSTDPHLPQHYDAIDLTGKAAAKRHVLEAVGLASDSAMARPLVAMVSRLVDQKGFDLLAALVDVLPQFDATFVLLGTGEARYENLWRALARRAPDRFAARFAFDEALAHQIEAGADILLMPSRFEPCGLNQMYSLRYGTVPLVRATGGLDDTVTDYTGPGSGGNGFKFAEYSPQALRGALERALAVFQDEAAWDALRRAGMREDHSWDASAREYVKVYERAIAARARAPQ